ncbi:MAG: hypothetical protein HQK53_15865 [Oligoflexia bacterium]|nr:hypothetical protein [Oligoflexia bacterium]
MLFKSKKIIATLVLSPLFALCCNYASVYASSAPAEFIIGNNNSDQTIAELKSLTDLPITEIEQRARPCKFTTWRFCSSEGFLGEKESFIQRLITDNQYVHARGLTHQQLAYPLKIMRDLDPQFCKYLTASAPFPTDLTNINGPRAVCSFKEGQYAVAIECTNGFQMSIFNDNLRSSCIVHLKKLERGRIRSVA